MDESPEFGKLGELYSSLRDETPEFRKLRELYRSLVKGDESTVTMKYPDLINIENKKGMIGLQLLSKNPSAFKSGRKYGLLKRFIYYYMILPSTY